MHDVPHSATTRIFYLRAPLRLQASYGLYERWQWYRYRCCALEYLRWQEDQLSLGKTHYAGAAYALSVAILTFKVIQGQWFSCHLKTRMPLPISDLIVTLTLSLTVSEIWLVFPWKARTFFLTLLHLTPNLKMFLLHKFRTQRALKKANYSCKFSAKITLSHNTSVTYGRTDRQRTTIVPSTRYTAYSGGVTPGQARSNDLAESWKIHRPGFRPASVIVWSDRFTCFILTVKQSATTLSFGRLYTCWGLFAYLFVYLISFWFLHCFPLSTIFFFFKRLRS